MSRRARIIRNFAIGFVAAILMLISIALLAVRSERFQQYVRQKVIAAIASGTGGRTEIGSLELDLVRLHARISNLLIHGSEPAGAAPFVSVAQIDLDVRFFSGGHLAGITYLGIQRPRVNVITFPDGTTNVPTPKPSAPAKETPLETVVDLAVSHFSMSNGELTYDAQSQPLALEANNLQVQLWYHLLRRDYEGNLSLDPIYVVSGRQKPVTYRLTLAVALHRDEITLTAATITSAASQLRIDGAIRHMRRPALAVRVHGRIGLADLQNTLGLNLDIRRKGLPDTLQLYADAAISASSIDVNTLQLGLGRSEIHASGVLKGASSGTPFRFQGRLALPELTRLLGTAVRPQGTMSLDGQAEITDGNQYHVSGRAASNRLDVDEDSLHLHDIDLSTTFDLTPARLELKRLRVAGLGGEIAGKASLEHLARYSFDGSLHHLNLAALGAVVQQRVPYRGVISGPVQANGDLHTANARSIAAAAQLAIEPDGRGIPMYGRIVASVVRQAE